MNLNWTAALAGVGLALSPVAARAAVDQVEFSEAMACSALYTVLAGGVEGKPEYQEFVDIASRWLVIANLRDDREDVVTEAELREWVYSLVGELNGQVDDAAREAFLLEGINICEANYQLIAEEFDSIDTE